MTNFESVLIAAHGDLKTTARRMGLSPSDADDVAQAVCVKALVKRHTFEGDARDQRAWLATIARNHVHDTRRNAKRRGEVDISDGLQVSGNENPEAVLYFKQVAGRIEALAPGYRRALWGAGTGEIEARSQRARVSKARKVLRRNMTGCS